MAAKTQRATSGAAAVRSATKIITGNPSKKPAEHEIQKKIQERAYHYFLERGRIHGFDREDWARAEKEVRRTL